LSKKGVEPRSKHGCVLVPWVTRGGEVGLLLKENKKKGRQCLKKTYVFAGKKGAGRKQIKDLAGDARERVTKLLPHSSGKES